MCVKTKSLRNLISVDEYRLAEADILKMKVDQMLVKVPKAQHIEITVIEYYEDKGGDIKFGYDYTEGGAW